MQSLLQRSAIVCTMAMRARPSFVSILCLLLAACRGTEAPAPTPPFKASPEATRVPVDPFDAWLRADFPVADGFDLPVATGGDVRAIAHGRVASVSGATVAIDHVFYENHERRQIRSVYQPVATVSVRAGAVVERGDPIAATVRAPIDLRLELSEQGLLTREAAAGIATAWLDRRPTARDTALGGGIGLHGWADDWDLDGPRRLSWGCVVMRNADIARVFDRIPVGAMVVIF